MMWTLSVSFDMPLSVAFDSPSFFLYYISMLDIITLGNEILTQVADPVGDIDKSVEDFVSEMFEALYKGNGIGLAAPQVGILKKIFVCHAQGDKPRAFINPEIIRTSPEEVLYEEGCLSIPGIWADVRRPGSITVQAFDITGKPFTIDADGILARVIQHEYDHLKGILFIDRLSELKKQRALKAYQKKQRV